MAQNLDREQVSAAIVQAAATAPLAMILTQAAAGHYIMNMRMVSQLPAPAVEHPEAAEFGSQMPRLERDLFEALGAFFKEQGVKELLR